MTTSEERQQQVTEAIRSLEGTRDIPSRRYWAVLLQVLADIADRLEADK